MVANIVVDIEFSDITHHPQSGVQIEHQCVLPHRLFELVCLDSPAYSTECSSLNFRMLFVGRISTILFDELGHLLAYRDCEESG